MTSLLLEKTMTRLYEIRHKIPENDYLVICFLLKSLFENYNQMSSLGSQREGRRIFRDCNKSLIRALRILETEFGGLDLVRE